MGEAILAVVAVAVAMADTLVKKDSQNKELKQIDRFKVENDLYNQASNKDITLLKAEIENILALQPGLLMEAINSLQNAGTTWLDEIKDLHRKLQNSDFEKKVENRPHKGLRSLNNLRQTALDNAIVAINKFDKNVETIFANRQVITEKTKEDLGLNPGKEDKGGKDGDGDGDGGIIEKGMNQIRTTIFGTNDKKNDTFIYFLLIVAGVVVYKKVAQPKKRKRR